jgi:hypothetical protein
MPRFRLGGAHIPTTRLESDGDASSTLKAVHASLYETTVWSSMRSWSVVFAAANRSPNQPQASERTFFMQIP